MSAERPDRVYELFAAALGREPAERPGFLEAACAGDASLRAELDRLLAHDERARRDGFFDPSSVRTIPGAPPPDSQPGPSLGGRVGDYEIVGELGRGGMGVVYKARHLRLDRAVALKMILDKAHAGTDQRMRFLREAEAVARVQHPNVVQIHEIGTHEGNAYLALEFIDGPTLAAHCDHRPQAPRWAAEVVEVLARAVHHIHERGVIHRDLKPGNVMLAEGSTVKVMDFGLARQVEAGAAMTHTGTVMGTPSYIAPEQAGGRTSAVGPAADVWALGAILYELLTGRPPFQAETMYDTLLQVMGTEPVPVRRLQPTVPRDLETVCLKCLQKDTAKRYSSARELADDLRRFLNDEPITARPVGILERGWRWCRRNPLAASLLGAVAGVLLLGASVATVLALHANAQTQLAAAREQQAIHDKQVAQEEGERAARALAREAEEKDLKARQLMTAQLLRVAGVFERDPGQGLALLHDVNACPIALRDTAWRFYERACSRWQLHVLQGHTAGVSSVAFSPDGLTLASGSDDQTVRLWDGKSGQAKATLQGHTLPVMSVAYSPDGLTIASGSEDETVRLWEAKTGRHKATLQGHTGWVGSLAYSPDGQTLASGSRDNTVRLWDVKTGQVKATLQGHTDWVESMAFSPDGSTLATASGDETVRLWDVTTAQLKATLQGHTDEVDAVAFSPDGLTLASASYDRTVRLWDVKTGQHKATLQGHTSPVRSVAYSPDGLTLASSSGENWTGEARLWDVRTGQHRASLQGHRGFVFSVAFSPDGLTLASGSWDNTVRLWDVTTGQPKATLQGHSDWVESVAFSPDGLTLASASSFEVWLWDVKSGRHKATLKDYTSIVKSVAFSPDGLTLATGSDEKEVRLWDVKTGQAKATLQGHTGEVSSVAFCPDGLTLASGSEDQTVRLWDVKTGQHRATLQGHKDGVESVAFSPDGQRVFGWDGGGYVRAWTAADGKPTGPHQAPPHSFNSVATGPDGIYRAEGRTRVAVLIELARYDPERERAERRDLEPVRRVWWHQQQLAQAEQDQNWFTAAFHLGQLFKDKPNNAGLRQRRDAALEKLKPLAPMEPLPRP